MDRNLSTEIRSLAEVLEHKAPSSIKAVIGFDGFVDEVVHVVHKRLSPKEYTRVLTLTEYGRQIAATSGLSSNVEIVTVSKKLGGNGPILANALIEYGVKMSYIGAIGYPQTHPVFHQLAKRCEKIFSVCDPASTDAVEFEDGKIIRSKLSAFQELTLNIIKDRVGLHALAELLDKNMLIGFVNWALPPYSGQIWKGIYDEVLPLLKSSIEQKILFFDLADPASRQGRELKDVLETIRLFSACCKVILGLNLREAVQVANIFGGCFSCTEYNLRDIAACIRQYVHVDTLVIHPLKESCCIVGDKYYQRTGPFCAKPKLTTGAGDNFNAGFILGTSLGLEPSDALLIGMAASGFYVRNARSADFDELKKFLLFWSSNTMLD
jgi:hypothetical protein